LILPGSLRSTSITASGQTSAQMQHPVQSLLDVCAGKYPALFDSLEMMILLFGHTFTHRPQPLHRSAFIIILPAISSLILYKTPFFGEFLLKNHILTDYDKYVKSKYLKLRSWVQFTLVGKIFMQPVVFSAIIDSIVHSTKLFLMQVQPLWCTLRFAKIPCGQELFKHLILLFQ